MKNWKHSAIFLDLSLRTVPVTKTPTHVTKYSGTATVSLEEQDTRVVELKKSLYETYHKKKQLSQVQRAATFELWNRILQ